jgi:hypothetical protein
MDIKHFQQFIRDNGYAWPGGYPMLAIMSDGESLCVKCAKANYRLIRNAMKANDDSGWRVVGVDIHWEGEPETCAHCNADIESAYGIPEQESDK